MSLEISGNTSLSVGDVISLQIPIKEPVGGLSDLSLDPLYKSKWLIINITHLITRKSYIMKVDVVTDRTGRSL